MSIAPPEFIAKQYNIAGYSDDEIYIGRWLAQNSPSGSRADNIDYNQLIAAFPDVPESEIKETLYFLLGEGLLEILPILGETIKTINLDVEFFVLFDPITFDGINPENDAARIAEEISSSPEKHINVPELCSKYGWTVRRMNPALTVFKASVLGTRFKGSSESPFDAEEVIVETRGHKDLEMYIAMMREEIASL